uniref:Calx-beta domain-containing protein n=1 Tax=Hucho hucho TaxID=62062 RepID=A0A4W5MA43_9TELE
SFSVSLSVSLSLYLSLYLSFSLYLSLYLSLSLSLCIFLSLYLSLCWLSSLTVMHFTLSYGKLRFVPGDRELEIAVNVVDDDVPEEDEQVTITLLDVTTVGLDQHSRGALIDPQRAQALLTILPNGSPYGLIGWHLDSQYFLTQEPQSKKPAVNVTVVRSMGRFGSVWVTYQTAGSVAVSGVDFTGASGRLLFGPGQTTHGVVLALLPDAVPELEELYVLRLSSVEGGATLDTNRSTTLFMVRANDEPHGVFGLVAERQAVVVVGRGAGLVRLLALNVTRQAGAFGNASVGYRISTGPGLDGQELLGEAAVGRVLIKHGEDSASDSVPISTQVREDSKIFSRPGLPMFIYDLDASVGDHALVL